MADVIVKRTVFADLSGGRLRFADFARVLTKDGGTYVEPFLVNPVPHNPADAMYRIPDDEMSRVDEIQFIDLTRRDNVLSYGSELVFHGGQQVLEG